MLWKNFLFCQNWSWKIHSMSIKRFIIFTKSDDVLKEKQFYCNKRAHFYVPSNLDIYSYFFVKLFFHDCKTILFEKLASFLQFGFCLPQVTFCYQKYSSWRLRIVREGGNQKKKILLTKLFLDKVVARYVTKWNNHVVKGWFKKWFLNGLLLRFEISEISKFLLTCDAPAIFFVGKSPPFLWNYCYQTCSRENFILSVFRHQKYYYMSFYLAIIGNCQSSLFSFLATKWTLTQDFYFWKSLLRNMTIFGFMKKIQILHRNVPKLLIKERVASGWCFLTILLSMTNGKWRSIFTDKECYQESIPWKWPQWDLTILGW